MSDPPRPTYGELGLIPALHSQPPPHSPNTPKAPIQIRIHKAKAPISPRPTKVSKADDIQTRARPLRTFTRFMELPLEIRRLVYRFAFTANFGVIGSRYLRLNNGAHGVYYGAGGSYNAVWRQDRTKRRSPLAAGLLRANHQLYHEAIEYLYRTNNTVIITSAKMLNNLVVIPDNRFGKCSKLECEMHAPQGGPLFENAIFYPREYDCAWSHHDENMEYLLNYLPACAGMITFKNLSLDISTSYPSLRNMKQALSSPNLNILETLTLRGWDFQRSLRIWVKSRDCVELIEGRGMSRKPTAIEEMPSNPDNERYSWSVTWTANKNAAPGQVGYVEVSDNEEADSQATEGDTDLDGQVTEGDPDDNSEATEEDADDGDVNGDADHDEDEDGEIDDEGTPTPTTNIKGLRDWNQKGQCKLSYRQLKVLDIPDENLDLSEIFPKVEVMRRKIERLMGGGVVGE